MIPVEDELFRVVADARGLVSVRRRRHMEPGLDSGVCIRSSHGRRDFGEGYDESEAAGLRLSVLQDV